MPAAFRAALPAALGWSFTRHKLLRSCERAAYWQYWGARDGWRDGAPRETRRAYALKHLTAVPLLLGQAVHAAAHTLVTAARDGRRRPTYEALLAAGRATMNRVWRDSQPDRIARFWRWPADYPALHEVVYGGGVAPAAAEAARRRLAACLRHLVTTPVLGDVATCNPADVLLGGPGPERVVVDLPEHVARGTRSPAFGPLRNAAATAAARSTAHLDRVTPFLAPVQATVWFAVDLSYRHQEPGTCRGLRAGDGSAAPHLRPGGACWCVTDFKTGAARPAEEALQLAVYAFGLEARGMPTTDGVYLGRIVNLRTHAESWYALRPEDLTRARAVVAADVGRQLALIRDATDASRAAHSAPAPRATVRRHPDTAPAPTRGDSYEDGESRHAPVSPPHAGLAVSAFSLATDRRRCPACNFFALCCRELDDGSAGLTAFVTAHEPRGGPTAPASADAQDDAPLRTCSAMPGLDRAATGQPAESESSSAPRDAPPSENEARTALTTCRADNVPH